LAKIADVTVLAVDYRLAPEHPGPAAVDDAAAAFGWVRQRLHELGGDPGAGVALAGDSAGGALAVLAAVRLHADGMTPSALLLAYPNANMTLRGASVSQEGHGFGLPADDLRWLVEQWLGDPDRSDDPELSPQHADLSGLPGTLLATAEHDPLRDEGEALARRLRDVGVGVQHVPYDGLVHGFLGLGHVSEAAGEASRDLFRRFGALIRTSAAA
jgi:acetyl esterase